MKARSANHIPVYITGVVLILAIALHALSRSLSTSISAEEKGTRVDTALVEQIEALTYDARVKLGAALNDPRYISPQLATLFFDDFAVEKVNDGSYSHFYAPATNRTSAQKLYPRRWPWPRFIHGQVVRELAAEGALAVGFDSMFPEVASYKPEEVVVDPESGPLSSDEFFATELNRAGNVFLGVERDTLPAPLFRTNAAGLASIASRADFAVLRRVKPFHEVLVWAPFITEYLVKPLGLQLSRTRFETNKLFIPMIGVGDSTTNFFTIPLNPNGSMKMTSDGQINSSDDPAEEGVQDQFPFSRERVWNLGLTLAARALNLDLEHPEFQRNRIILRGLNGLKRAIPVDDAGYLYIDWSIRFQDLKAGKTPIYFGQLSSALINDRFRSQGDPVDQVPYKDKIVLVGSIATGNNMSDFGASPLEAQTPLVTKHLNIANSILTGRFVERTSLGVETLVIVLLGLISALITWRLRVLVAAISITLLCLCYLSFTIWMYLDHRYWLAMVMPVAGGLIGPHFCLVTYRVIFEQKEQRRVRGIFSKIVSPDVVKELLDAEKLLLGGARRRITVFFADVRGFTEFTDANQQAAEEYAAKNRWTEAERHAYFNRIAAEHLATVNLYLTTIADKVKNQNGTLDKYMGDCVMAFWGAPTENEQHALCCVRAAIDAQRSLADLNQQRFLENEERKKQNLKLTAEGKPPLQLLPLLSLGSGINTGYATVGLMGSDATILNYTVFGREINLASRLEGISGRGRILISESTYEDLRRDDPQLAALCVAQTPVTPKGFRNPIPVYEVPWKLDQMEIPPPPPSALPQPLTTA